MNTEIDKVEKVIASCKTLDQLESASRYLDLAYIKYDIGLLPLIHLMELLESKFHELKVN